MGMGVAEMEAKDHYPIELDAAEQQKRRSSNRILRSISSISGGGGGGRSDSRNRLKSTPQQQQQQQQSHDDTHEEKTESDTDGVVSSAGAERSPGAETVLSPLSPVRGDSDGDARL